MSCGAIHVTSVDSLHFARSGPQRDHAHARPGVEPLAGRLRVDGSLAKVRTSCRTQRGDRATHIADSKRVARGTLWIRRAARDACFGRQHKPCGATGSGKDSPGNPNAHACGEAPAEHGGHGGGQL
jgi:hypothetical protein